MADKEVAFAIIGAAVAIAGMVLVYSAFLIAKAASFDSTVKAKKFIAISRWSLAPVLWALFCALAGVRVLLPGRFGSDFAASWLIFGFEILLVITAIYAILAAFTGT